MKVKIFYDSEPYQAECSINKWFSENPQIILKNVIQSQSVSSSGYTRFFISIFYEESLQRIDPSNDPNFLTNIVFD